MKTPTYLDPTNAITAAILPLKTDAIERAEQEARLAISRVLHDFEDAGWDLDKVAPRGDSWNDPRNYKTMMAKHNFYNSLSTYTAPTRMPGQPNTRKRSEEAEARFIKNAREDAALQYDMFVAKLVRKIGACETATLAGSHVWGHSILTVTKADASIERWKTQTIINVSVHGKLFNQWPSRKVK